MAIKPINLFYQEPDPDRWFKFDRYPRKIIRRLIRGKQRPGGVMMVAINLMKGLDKLGVSYRLNDYVYIKKRPDEIACIIGKPHVLFEREWVNPVIFGAGIFSHPIDCPDLLKKYPTVKRILVPGEWMQKMFEPYYGDKVVAWPTGIDVDEWRPFNSPKEYDFLIYDKIRWQKEKYAHELVGPITATLNQHKLSYHTIKYGTYKPVELKEKLARAKAVIFLCEHETQGLAYQQILATGTPILAWDRDGYWQDPEYYPDRVKYEPVSSVPYWSKSCGKKFSSVDDFEKNLSDFLAGYDSFNPRSYIVENLSLEKCAKAYLEILNAIHDTI
ncbi:MAG TPA: glycosyltransferase [Mucilaginibacter sp.]|jgi:glycosyltransferase involved in cell wall biosynthesis|nr:glycosyltransferase [Mucilaginibacter sp.]